MRSFQVVIALVAVGCTPPSTSISCDSDADCVVGRCLEDRCIEVPGIDAGQPEPPRDAGSPRRDAGSPQVDAGTPGDDGGPPTTGDPIDDAGVPGDGFGVEFIDNNFRQRARIRLIVPVEIPAGDHVIPLRLTGPLIVVPNQVAFYNETQTATLPVRVRQPQRQRKPVLGSRLRPAHIRCEQHRLVLLRPRTRRDARSAGQPVDGPLGLGDSRPRRKRCRGSSCRKTSQAKKIPATSAHRSRPTQTTLTWRLPSRSAKPAPSSWSWMAARNSTAPPTPPTTSSAAKAARMASP